MQPADSNTGVGRFQHSARRRTHIRTFLLDPADARYPIREEVAILGKTVPARLILEITSGPLKGYHYAFDRHDILLVGRHADCHARLPRDRLVSRHHCLVEINPPEATLRDLGSRNGTYVNGVRHGGRALNETPEQASSRQYPEVRLKKGDQIKVGETAMEVVVSLLGRLWELRP